MPYGECLTCEAFRRMYQNSRREYPSNVSDQDYLQRMKDCYPIHPEIFDRLFQDWSTIPGFQKTRGVLRIMATCISRLYQEQAPSLLIMPVNLPLDDPTLAAEFTRLLARSGGSWDPGVQEIDSHGSRTDQIDIGTLYFLYNLNERYYFHTQENLNRVAIDRAAEYTEDDIHAEIVSRLERAVQNRASVSVCPMSPNSVNDVQTLQFVVLHPQVSFPNREREMDTAGATALNVLR